MSAARRAAGLSLAALLAIGAASALAPAGADAQQRSHQAHSSERGFVSDHWASDPDDWGTQDDWGWTMMEMQREAIASQEEAQREAGRVRARDELEKQQAAESAEHEAYYGALLDASRAALRAPQGVYYRKPGFTTSTPPAPDAQAVTVGGVKYLYERGIFWLQQGQDYVVVTAPPGAVVDALPAGAYAVDAEGKALQYFFGTFFRENAGRYEVVLPPPGVVVIYVPDGYVTEQRGGATVYRFGAVGYRPVFVQGILAYQVVGP